MRTSSGWLLVRFGVVLKDNNLYVLFLNVKPTLKSLVVVHATPLCSAAMSMAEQQASQWFVVTPRFERAVLALKDEKISLFST